MKQSAMKNVNSSLKPQFNEADRNSKWTQRSEEQQVFLSFIVPISILSDEPLVREGDEDRLSGAPVSLTSNSCPQPPLTEENWDVSNLVLSPQ